MSSTMEYQTPLFFVRIDGSPLNDDITQRISSFTFTDNEESLDQLDIIIMDQNGSLVDDPALVEGGSLETKFGYIGNLSPKKHLVVKQVEYNFDNSSGTSIRITAYDKGLNLAGKVRRKVWSNEAEGITYAEIAEQMAQQLDLKPVVTQTAAKFMRLHQSCSDAEFLYEMSQKCVSEDGQGGYIFFVENGELHFHPRNLEESPQIILQYGGKNANLLSFSAQVNAQGAKGAGVQTKAIGIDPKTLETIEAVADNTGTTSRTLLGKETTLADGTCGEEPFGEDQTGTVVGCDLVSGNSSKRSSKEIVEDTARAKFIHAEMGQVTGTATILGMPELKAKQNIEVRGVGERLSGLYYCKSICHRIGSSGYICELSLIRNALGKNHENKKF